MPSTPLVSVCCDTYNQAPYIGKALDSILMQKTAFPFEVIVHDDASTDGTADVVRAYAARYPDTVRAVLRETNRFSVDPKILEHCVFPLARGKYVAILEGDDYWTDANKLQKQVDYMEAHENCTLLFHAAELVDRDGRRLGWQRPYPTSRAVPTEDVIRGMGGFCPTASLMTRAALAKGRAPFCDMVSVDDCPLQLFFASRGDTYYMQEAMCAYRVEAPGSWTLAQKRESVEKRVALQESLIRMHEAFDADTGGRWHGAVADAITTDRFEILWLNRDLIGMRRPEYRALYRKLPLRTRAGLYVKTYCPRLYARLRRQ